MINDGEVDPKVMPERTKVGNRVREMRIDEGVPRARLASLAGISDKTVRDIERGIREGSDVTKAKIVNGFNRLPGKKRVYTFETLFPTTL
jgi:DNA-binding XRE family transcriptional regulator